MMFHYFNILLCSLPLNILSPSYEINMKSHNRSTLHTLNAKPIKIYRSLCECDLYTSTYDNDPEMKEVMQQFDDRAAQRFKEYEEMLQYKRKQCKEQCDKDIQKIILKDKIEKELTENFSSLQTDISTNDIPTCICEKSVADKVEKTCLKCGGILGGGIAPGWSLVSGLGYAVWTNYVTQTALQKGIEAGVKAGIEGLRDFFGLNKLIPISQIENLVNPTNYFHKMTYVTFTQKIKISMCVGTKNTKSLFCSAANCQQPQLFSREAAQIAENAVYSSKIATTDVLDKAAPVTSGLNTAIIASIVAIVVIILVMVIIYIILRYRRKKKIHKKLQYIKLLQQ
ncbi:hypothetical protein PFAG_01659 [Plasmodium falciparum Santa Lucia]|uniref:Rifin n=2 Tax=Plasmodium falciparum TaxID=5833 RepID=A0A0L7KGS3_PLAFX|nr:hypothetical protein PFAG_01659 [Plasmodium falciparum Santa Lucia]KOB62261.1 hypothetical protein PFHG_04016 [Plasmodium falciparum HB3]